LPPRIECIHEAIVARLELMYRPELSTLSEAERKALVIALEAEDALRKNPQP